MMQCSIFEQQRRALETIDLTEYLISELLMRKQKKIHEQLAQEHSIRRLLDNSLISADFLIKSFGLQDSSDSNPYIMERGKELSLLETNVEMSEFYSRLRTIKEDLRSHADEPAMPLMDELLAIKDIEIGIEAMFSGDEGFGRFLDLNASHLEFVNLKDIGNVDYLTYLDRISSFENIPKETKKSSAYLNYLEDLSTYLRSFILRAKPLMDVEFLHSKINAEFVKLVQSGALQFTSAYSCSVCSRSFEKETVYMAHLNSPKHMKKAAHALSAHKTEKLPNRDEITSKLEFHIHYYFDNVLALELSSTKGNIERKQSSTISELDSRHRHGMTNGDDDNVEELDTNALKHDLEKFEAQLTKAQEEKLYNPLKLPLGWDGKPIPYWLYKLHGLGVSYSCEICGNYIYMGRRVFDKHFQEWRHSYGMKCLGIPNTRHFQDITAIADAYALWEKIKKSSKVETFKSDTMEEFEDFEGNVYNRKTFEDLHRQGLL
ncbi:Pre-mRNA-splicing factor sap61 [Mitosporidium daphniae]